MSWSLRLLAVGLACAAAGSLHSPAAVPEAVGMQLLRSATTNLDGTGVRVTQAEAAESGATPPPFQVSPALAGLPVSRFTYYVGPPDTNAQSTSTFPNSLGSASGHASAVASFFFRVPSGMSTNVAHIDNFEAGYFFDTVVPNLQPSPGRVVVQAYIVPGGTTNDQRNWDSAFDDYAAHFDTLFVSGIGNGGPVNPPSTCYNGIGVGAFGGSTSIGPTPENGRAKPDLVAPGSVTSYSTPLVAGAATLLIQAGLRGDGGVNTNAAADIRTVKALLLNGAVKPSDWTAPAPSPLDRKHGAGVLNVFNSWNQLAGGEHEFISTSSVPLNAVPDPLNAAENVPGRSGWDFSAISNTASADRVHHYLFDLAGDSDAPFTGTATLVWNRQENRMNLNDLDLLLCDAVSGAAIAASTSRVDNVEHVYLPSLPAGRYDLRVIKRGGAIVTQTENYALAFEFFAMALNVTQTGSTLNLSWPDYPDGFRLQASPDLEAWGNVTNVPAVVNRQKSISIETGAERQFFRLRRP
jgi:hypothetical protein